MNTVIRPWSASDLGSLVENANNRAVWLNLRDLFPFPYREEDGRRWLAYVAGLEPVTHFAIQRGGVAVGGVGVVPGKDVERISGEVGYWLGEAHWGKGLATAALRELVTYTFVTLGLRRVFAVPFARNLASVRVLEKAGFRREGLLVESALKNGRLESQFIYAVTKPEWERRAASSSTRA